MQDILVYGSGGHSKVTIDLLEKLQEFNIKGILDDNKEQWGKEYFGYKILGGINILEETSKDCKIAIGIASPKTRQKVFEAVQRKGYSVPTLIHPTACIAKGVVMEEGVIVMAHAVINADAKIGKGTVINTSAIVEHECDIGDFTHICPGTHLAGKVIVKDNAFVGLGSCIIEFNEIGEGAIVGAGSVVTKNVPPNTTVVGNPARILKKNDSNS